MNKKIKKFVLDKNKSIKDAIKKLIATDKKLVL